jgi:hypothetical protein
MDPEHQRPIPDALDLPCQVAENVGTLEAKCDRRSVRRM